MNCDLLIFTGIWPVQVERSSCKKWIVELFIFRLISHLSFRRNVMAKSGFVPAWMKIPSADVSHRRTQKTKSFIFFSFYFIRKRMAIKN